MGQNLPKISALPGHGVGPALAQAHPVAVALGFKPESRSLRLRREGCGPQPELFPELAVTSSVRNNIELNLASANKGAALEALCRHLGVAMEETVAFGDGTNDLTMLRAAGLGVAMANAAPEVKAAADRVTDDNEHAGVAKVINEFLR